MYALLKSLKVSSASSVTYLPWNLCSGDTTGSSNASEEVDSDPEAREHVPIKHGAGDVTGKVSKQQGSQQEQEYLPCEDPEAVAAASTSEELSSRSSLGEAEESQEQQQRQRRQGGGTANQRSRKRRQSKPEPLEEGILEEDRGTRRRQVKESGAAGEAVAAGGGALGHGDDEDWELQLALQLSMAEDVHAPLPAAMQSKGAAGTSAAGGSDRREEITSRPLAVSLPGDKERSQQQQRDHKQQQQQSRTAGQRKLSQSRGGQVPPAAAGGGDATDAGEADEAAPHAAVAGTLQQNDERKGRGTKKGGGGGRRRRSGGPPALELSTDDMFELYAMFEPGDEGIIDARHLAQQMQKLGMPEVDEELLNEMISMGVQVQGGVVSSRVGSGAGGSKHLGRPQLSLEGFMLLTKQVLGCP
jgi:hypothetical protein